MRLPRLNSINPRYRVKAQLILVIATIHLIFSLALFKIDHQTNISYHRAALEIQPSSLTALTLQYHPEEAGLRQSVIGVDWRTFPQHLIVWGVVLGGLSGAILCWTTERLLTPLTEIATAAQPIERREETKVLDISDFGELARLTKEQKMSLQSLEKVLSYSEIKRLHQELEKSKQAEALLVQENQALQQLTMVDGLTEVANRRRFNQYFEQEWRRSAREQIPLSLILCDIDYFKAYNDTYGHQAGDDCLMRVAQAIGSTLKRPADLVARYGGEEFVVVLPNTNKFGALYIAQEIQGTLRALQIPHRGSIISDHVTLSFGVATAIPVPHEDKTLIATADQRLYQAKQKRDRIIG